jgi:formamidopyrimidine-DNA glycosylase
MPEGHTIHRLALDHGKALAGQVLRVSSPQGRFEDAARLDGLRLVRTEAHGKHLFYVFEKSRVLHIHLGLFGRYFAAKSPATRVRPTTRLLLEGAERSFALVGPTACELLSPTRRRELLARLGPDPLRPDADLDVVRAALARRKTPIGQVLLDQSVIAGVGNVYRAEALLVTGIHPQRPCKDLSDDQVDALWATLRRMLQDGVRDRRIITVAPEELPGPRSKIRRKEAVYVYGRRTCLRCGGAVSKLTSANRTLYACLACQTG